MSEFRSLAFGALLALGTSSAHAEEVRAVVYFHDVFHHYFMTANAAEIAALDARSFPGWWRAGQRFLVDSESGPGTVPVCRFLTTAHGGKASHFFTASAAECEAVKGKPDWTYEGIAFHVRTVEAGDTCSAGTVAIHRLYNNGRGGAPNHAYTPEIPQRERLKANGFVEEGVAFCVRVEGEPVEKLQPFLGTTWDFDDYNDFMGGLGTMRMTFGATAGTTAALDSKFFAVGMPVTGVNTSYTTSINDGRSGAMTWDRVSASYQMFVDTEFGLQSVYTFDAFDPAKLSVCMYDVVWRVPEHLPAFQTLIWAPITSTGCAAGTATRR